MFRRTREVRLPRHTEKLAKKYQRILTLNQSQNSIRACNKQGMQVYGEAVATTSIRDSDNGGFDLYTWDVSLIE